MWLAAALLAGACGGEAKEKPRPAQSSAASPAKVVTERFGRGAQTTFVIRPEGAGPHPAVLFLHGWGATLPANYRPWIDHLVRQGNAVIYPRYQESFLSPPDQVLGNLIAGVRLALADTPIRPETLVVAGHSAGGALSADYAAVARSARLPAPRAILSLYPGRTLRGIDAGIPEVAPARIPRGTRIVALAGAKDATVGTAPAKRIVASATGVPRARRRYELIRDPAVSDHLGPQRATASSRRTFWRRLDALIAEARP